MENQGWIKLHRKFQTWEWANDSNMVSLFIHLLLLANHKERKWHGETIKPGQLITGLYSLSKTTGLSVQSLRTCLDRLKSTSEITSKVTNKFRVITIVKWADYQGSEEEVTSTSTSKVTINQQSTNNQSTTNKNVKNVKNDNKNTGLFYKNIKCHISPINGKLGMYDNGDWKELNENFPDECSLYLNGLVIADGYNAIRQFKINNNISP